MLLRSMFETLEGRRLMSTTFLGTLGSAFSAVQVVNVTIVTGELPTDYTALQTPGGHLVIPTEPFIPTEPVIPGNPIIPVGRFIPGWFKALIPGNPV